MEGREKWTTLLFFLAALGSLTQAQDVKFLLVTESTQGNLVQAFTDGMKMVETSSGKTFEVDNIEFERKKSDEKYQDMCTKLKTGTFSAVVDMAWGGWIKGRKTANELGLPYIRLESANHLFVQAADDFLRSQKAVDAALIFEDQMKLDQSLYYIIGNSFLRIIGAQLEDTGAYERLKKMRPRPSNYVAWGSTASVKKAYEMAKTNDMLKRDTRWTLVFQDMKSGTFTSDGLDDQTNFLEMLDESNCCTLMDKAGSKNRIR